MVKGKIVVFVLGALCVCASVLGQASNAAKNPLTIRPQNRIIRAIEDQDRVALTGNHLSFVSALTDAEAVPAGQSIEKMVLVLHSDTGQQQALESLLEQQRDPNSSLYHQWLTPEQYAERFGASDSDLNQIVTWLQSHGLQVDEIPTGRSTIVFSGTAAQVESAFHPQLRRFKLNGEVHSANSTDPEIPRALAGVVTGISSLHDFRSTPMHVASSQASKPEFTSGSAHYLAPDDLAKIYNVSSLYSQGYDGSGQSIAIVGRSNIYVSDVRSFRSTFGLPAKDPVVIVPTTDPGTASSGDVGEAMLDVEWAGALARNATIDFVAAASTYSTDGVDLSAQYIVNHNVAPIMSVSYGLCEQYMGASQNSFYDNLWKQAAAQGISVFVSSGDSGAAGCDSSGATKGSHGRAVNGLCTSSYSTCVGGTQFDDTSNPSLYWSSSNLSGSQSSALGYIPEKVWNESGSTGLWSSGGGVSTVYSKPSWQTGPGVPSDGMRDVPDVSLTAAGHDGYLVRISGGLYVYGGTSAASPSFASIMALVVQKEGAPQGNINPTLYALANRQQLASGAAVFHDVVTGSNSVSGVTGYSAGVGYDLATGLGSVDANQLVLHWNDAGSAPSLTVASSSSNISILPSASTTLSVSTAVSGGFSAAVTFTATQLPTGITASFTPSSFVAPGSGTTTVKFTASSTVVAGTYTVKLNATGKGVTSSTSVTLTILPAPSFTFTSSVTTLSVLPGASGSGSLSVSPNSTFNSAVSISVAGMPAGMTATLSPASLVAPGTGTATLSVRNATTVAPGTYTLTVTATGGGVVKKAAVSVLVPGFSLTESASSLSLNQGLSSAVTLSTAVLGGLSSAISFSASGLPSGVTASFAPSSITAPGTGKTVVTFSANAAAPLGAATITLTATAGSITKSVNLALTLIPPPSFSLTVPTSLSVYTGSTATATLSTGAMYGFSSPLQWSVSGAPASSPIQLSATTTAAGGKITVTAKPSASAPAGTYPLTVTVTGGGVTRTAQFNLVVVIPAVYTLSAGQNILILQQGGSSRVTLSTVGTVTFNSAVAFSVSGLPSGMTAVFSPAAISLPGSGSTSLVLTATSATVPGTYSVTVNASGGGVARSVVLTVSVPGFTLSGLPASLTITRGHTASMTLSVTAVAGFSAPMSVSVSGLPSGVTGVLSSSSIAAPGTGRVVITLTANTSATPATSTLQITASGGSKVKTISLPLKVQ